MKEYGGYFELELTKRNNNFHKNAFKLNLGRNALKYIIRAYKIENLYVPIFTCPTIIEALISENCKPLFYDIDFSFMPTLDFPSNAFILYTNYFGVCSKNIDVLATKYRNLIIDNCHALFSQPHPNIIASFYSPRKFFGVTDGSYLYCKKTLDEDFPMDISYPRFKMCLKRLELGSDSGYPDFIETEKNLNKEPIKKMSVLTQKILESVNWTKCANLRKRNALIIHKALGGGINELKFSLSDEDIPMKYPFVLKNDHLREEALKNKIFLTTHWKGMENLCNDKIFKISSASYFQKYLFPLPIDQRLTKQDISFIVNFIKKFIDK